MSNDKINISLKEVEDIAQACLVANGCNDENAKAVSTTIMAANRLRNDDITNDIDFILKVINLDAWCFLCKLIQRKFTRVTLT